MDLKIDLQRWHSACQAFDNKDYLKAMNIFLTCRPSSKRFFNIGVILVTLHDHQHALTMFTKAIEHDQYFSAAHFQSGVSNVMLDNLEQAVLCFDLAYKNLRGNKAINYRQLGLDFTLYACEILYNRGICQIYLGNTENGMDNLIQAQQLKMNHQHNIIDQTAQHQGQFNFGVYSLPPGVIYYLTNSQLQLLNGNELLSILYHSTHDIFYNDKQKRIDTTNNRTINKYLPKYLLPSSTTPKIPIIQKYTTPYLSMAPKPSTSPAPQPFFIQQQQKNNNNKLKLKLHYKDTRILIMHTDSTFHELQIKAQEKLDIPIGDTSQQLKLYLKNTDNEWIHIKNDHDWFLAKQHPLPSSSNVRLNQNAPSPMNKIEIWCRTLDY